MTSEQKEAFLNSWFGSLPECSSHWTHGMSGNIADEVNDRFDEAMQAYTRAAPDVPELVIVAYDADSTGKNIALVARSEAAAMIAAEKAASFKAQTDWRTSFDAMHRRAMEAEAKIAAKAAENERLRDALEKIA